MIDQPSSVDVAAPRGVVLGHSQETDSICVHWSPIVAGAFAATALSFVLLSFGTAIGLAVASPSASWRDTSATLAFLGGLWLLLISLASFSLGGYMAGRLRLPWRAASSEEVEFRDGIHGLLVWGLAIILAALLAFATTKAVPGRADLTAPTASTAEPLLAFELDRLFRTDRRPVDAGNDPELRAQAARIILAGVGRSGMSADDRNYLIRTVEARTGLSQGDAETRVNQAVAQAAEAIRQARRSAVILAFMTGASLMVGAAVAWLMATLGGQHRDGAPAHFWRRWEVDRFFVVR